MLRYFSRRKNASYPGFLHFTGRVLLALVSISLISHMVGFAQSAHAGDQVRPLPVKRVWVGPDGNPLPFASEGEVLDFLRTARVQNVENIPVGITKPKKVVLEKDGIQACAIFHFRHIVRTQEKLVDGETIRYFRDSYLNQIAAYELSRLLGMRRVPPTVLRKINGRKGSVQLWIEGAHTEKKRHEKGLQPTDPAALILANHDMRVFDNLINNIDRNVSNFLYDSNWDLWYVDHTRAFGRDMDLRDTKRLVQCCRSLWAKLQSLDEQVVRKTLKPYMGRMEIVRLLQRRDKIVAYFQKKIAREGEAKVLFDYPEKQ